MKLYYTPGVCSLASHIVLHQSGLPFEAVAVNLRDKTMASGGDFRAVNPRGNVPALEVDGEVLLEGAAIMQLVADRAGQLPAPGTLARARVAEMLNFVASEVHKSYSPLFRNPPEDQKAAQLALIDQKLAWIEGRLADGRAYVTGDSFTPADAYLFTITNWSARFGHDLERFPHLTALRAKVAALPAVQAAMRAEGLIA